MTAWTCGLRDDLGHLLDLDHQIRKHALRQTAVAKNGFDGQCALRHIGRMFQHHGIARHQGRCGSAKYLPERKVPRHDGQHHAERVIRDIAFTGIRFHRLGTQEFLAVAGVVFAGAGAFFDFGARFAQWLAHFQRDQGCILVALREQLSRHLAQYFGPGAKEVCAHSLLRAAGFFQHAFQIRRIPTGMGMNQLIGGWVEADKWHGVYPGRVQ